MISKTWRYWLAGLVALLALVGVITGVNAAFPTSGATSPPAPAAKSSAGPADDFDQLPRGLQGVSYSVLVNSGKVHLLPVAPRPPDTTWRNPFAPLLTIAWGADHLTGAGAGEPAAGINQTLPLNALISGNFSLDHTTDGGLTWTSIQPPNPHNSGDVTNAWLENAPSNALELSINSSGGYDYTCARTTDFGVTWATDAACGPSVSSPIYFDDREYIWVDHTPASPFYGRVYVTTAYFDAGGTGSYNTVSNRWSSDNGVSWNPPNTVPLALVPSNEFATGVAHNEYPSLGISANGTLGYAWRRGLCCGGSPTVGTNDKVMFARSTDGGVTFPFSNTIVTVPLANAISFNSNSPFGPRWSDTPNIAADPVTNGTFYAIWTAYRTANTPASAAIYLAKTTDNGVTWSTPVIPYNNPNASIFQGFGWVKVTADHTVHVTYFGGTTTNTAGAQFYVQSTDGGTTWSAPFQLNTINPTITGFASTTDYEAMDVTLSGGTGAILAGWDDQTGHHARLGTFLQGTPTPTVTGTPPTVTPTRTSTNTPTPTQTPCASAAIVNGGFETGSLPPWTVLGTNPTPVVSNALAHSGTYSALLGTVSGPEPNGDGSMYQTITVPAGGGTLSYWWNGQTTDSITFDWQDAYITDTSGTILTTIMHNCQTTGAWVNQTFNMAAYAGQTVRVEFLVHQDGFGDDTSMYVDDVQLLTACATGTPATATRTATTSASTPTRTVTPGGATATPTCAPSSGGWTAGPNLPTVLVRAVGVYFPADGNFYTVGGRTGDAAGSDFQHVLKYNPGTNTWTQNVTLLPDIQMNNMACGVLTVSGTPYIYCVGGSAAGQTTATARVFFYNPATDTVTTLTAADNWPGDSGGTTLPGGFAVANNKLYILGGFNINVASTNGIYAFDPTAAVGSKWTTSAATTPSGIMYAPTAYFPSTGLIYVTGASDYQGGTVVDTATSFSFNPATNTIGTIAAIPRATGETRALTVGSQIWVIGGGRVAPNPSTEIDIYTPASNTWSVGSPFTTARRNFPTDTNGSTVWLAGGYASDGVTALNSMEIFTPAVTCASPTSTATAPAATSTSGPASSTPTATATCGAAGTPGPWTAASPIPTAVFGPSVAGDGTNAYSAGGYSFSLAGATTQFARYNPATNTWTTLSPVPDAMYDGAAVYAPSNNKVYVFGGTDGSTVDTNTRIYDVAGGTWSAGAAMPAARQQMGAGYYNGKIYIAGGYDTTSVSPQNTLYAYDVAGNTWTTLAALPQALGGPGSGVINGHLYIAGGRDAANTNRTTVYDYNITTNTWSTAPAPLPTGVNVPGSAVAGGLLMVFGGGNPFFDPRHGSNPANAAPATTNVTQIYDPVANSWTAGSNLTTARSFVGGTAVGNYVVAVGGYDGSTSVATVDVATAGSGGCASPTPIGPTPTSPPASPTSPPASPTSPPASPTSPPASPTTAPTQTPGGPSATPVPSSTPLPTQTPGGPTATPVPSNTPSGPSPTPCSISFSDVHPSDYFYVPVTYLYCHGVISGYADGTFRPYANTTRSQMVKIVVLGFQKPIHTPSGGNYTFTDVPPANPFYPYVETAAALNIVSGYNCGGVGEPCDPQNRNYFRPFAPVTRGQLSKIDVVAAGWSLVNPPAPGSFEDVAFGSAFYQFVETAYCHNIISGYTCGGPGEPCDPGNRPYFRQGADATRGQIAKIVYLSITTTSICALPTPTPAP